MNTKENKDKNWTIITYEQLVLNPEPVIKHICEKFGLSRPDKIISRLKIPSAVTVQSKTGTKDLIKNDRLSLINKWKKSITEKEQIKLWNIIEMFNIKIYDIDSSYPVKEYTID